MLVLNKQIQWTDRRVVKRISVQRSVTNSVNIRDKAAELGTLLTGDYHCSTWPPITSTGAAKRTLAVRSDSLTLAQTLPDSTTVSTHCSTYR